MNLFRNSRKEKIDLPNLVLLSIYEQTFVGDNFLQPVKRGRKIPIERKNNRLVRKFHHASANWLPAFSRGQPKLEMPGRATGRCVLG